MADKQSLFVARIKESGDGPPLLTVRRRLLAEDGGFEPIRGISRKIGLLVPLKYPSPRETAPKMGSPRLGPFPGRRGLFQSRLFSCFILVMRSCRS